MSNSIHKTSITAALLLTAFTGTAGAQQLEGRTIAIPLHSTSATIPSPATARVRTGLKADVGPISVPTWNKNFVINTVTYPQVFVGTDPASTNTTTNINVPVIPLIIVLNDGTTYDPTKKLTTAPAGSALSANLAFVTSPIFQTSTYAPGGTTVGTGVQYGDAVQRATFWASVSTTSPNWHTVLKSTAQTAITLHVPAANGHANGALGLVDINWLAPQLDTLSQNYGATNFPIFLMYNVALYNGGSCCILGYHTAVQNGANLQTYAIGGYYDLGIINQSISDVSALSHEVTEWLNDPFVNNTVPDWPAPFSFTPPGPPYNPARCQNDLEVGDPIEDRSVSTFNVTTLGRKYSVANTALAQWFLRVSPSTAVNNWYTFQGPIDSEFAGPAPACTTNGQ